MDRIEKRMNNIVNMFKDDRECIIITYNGIDMNHGYHKMRKFLKIATKFSSASQQFMFGLLMAGYIHRNMPLRYRRGRSSK